MKLQPQSYPWVFWPFLPFLAIVQQEVSPGHLQSWAVEVLKQLWGTGLVWQAEFPHQNLRIRALP